MKPEQLARLPKHAQDYINKLRADLAAAETTLATLTSDQDAGPGEFALFEITSEPHQFRYRKLPWKTITAILPGGRIDFRVQGDHIAVISQADAPNTLMVKVTPA